MIPHVTKLKIAALSTLLIVAGCATKPDHIPSIQAGANATAEIAETEQMIRDAQNRQVDVLSPENFKRAQSSLEKARKYKDKQKSNEKILEEVAISRGFLEQANAKSEVAQTSMKDITQARSDAMAAGASTQYPNEFAKAGRDLEKITHAIEKGNLNKADERGAELTSTYKALETKSLSKAHLGRSEEIVSAALKDKANVKAPKSLQMAQGKLDNARRIILSEPKNTEAIRAAAMDADREAKHLASVMTQVNAGNTEDLVLMNRRQQKTISSLKDEYSTTEEELQNSQARLNMTEKEKAALAAKQTELQKSQSVMRAADEVRQQFKPNEAEVYAEGDKLMIRLKGLQFPSSQATLGPKNESLLKKVDAALAGVNASKITIEGHTDATGNPDKNVILSEKRAQAVENYLAHSGQISESKMEAVGVGPDKPISDNRTSRGRAENRRIDLVVEM